MAAQSLAGVALFLSSPRDYYVVSHCIGNTICSIANTICIIGNRSNNLVHEEKGKLGSNAKMEIESL